MDDVMYRQDLERLAADGCSTDGCQHTLVHSMFLHACCHPEAGMRVEYQGGALWLRCRHCQTLVTVVAVADTHARERAAH